MNESRPNVYTLSHLTRGKTCRSKQLYQFQVWTIQNCIIWKMNKLRVLFFPIRNSLNFFKAPLLSNQRASYSPVLISAFRASFLHGICWMLLFSFSLPFSSTASTRKVTVAHYAFAHLHRLAIHKCTHKISSPTVRSFRYTFCAFFFLFLHFTHNWRAENLFIAPCIPFLCSRTVPATIQT